MSEPLEEETPDPWLSPSAGPKLNADELEAKIRQRQREMEQTPCYRCGHTPSKPDPNCPCCVDAHTPDGDGHFSLMTAEEFAAMQEKP